MKLEFHLRCRLYGGAGCEHEYSYDFRFKGLTNYGKQFISGWNNYISYQKTAKEARIDITNRLSTQGAFDAALDGKCPYLEGCL